MEGKREKVEQTSVSKAPHHKLGTVVVEVVAVSVQEGHASLPYLRARDVAALAQLANVIPLTVQLTYQIRVLGGKK